MLPSRHCSQRPTRASSRCWSASCWCAVSTCASRPDAASCVSSRCDAPRSWRGPGRTRGSTAIALAEVAHASLWADTPDAQDAVEAAVEAAEAIDHPRVTAYAFAAAAMGAEFADRPGGPALRCPRRARAPRRHATGGASSTPHCGRPTRARATPMRPGPASSARDGSSWPCWEGPHPYLAWLSIDEAYALVRCGDWRGATELAPGRSSVPTRVRRSISRPDSWPRSWPPPRGGSTRPRTTSPGPTSCPPTRPPSWPGSSTRRGPWCGPVPATHGGRTRPP